MERGHWLRGMFYCRGVYHLELDSVEFMITESFVAVFFFSRRTRLVKNLGFRFFCLSICSSFTILDIFSVIIRMYNFKKFSLETKSLEKFYNFFKSFCEKKKKLQLFINIVSGNKKKKIQLCFDEFYFPPKTKRNFLLRLKCFIGMNLARVQNQRNHWAYFLHIFCFLLKQIFR